MASSVAIRQPPDSVAADVPLRILAFSHHLAHEGASISLQELVCALVRRGGISVEVTSFADGPLRADYEAHGVAAAIWPRAPTDISSLKRLEREVSTLATRIRESGAQLVFVNTLLGFPAILAAELAGVPSVWNPRESESWDRFFQFLPDPVAACAVSAIGLPRAVIFVAQATRRVWAEFESDARFAVIRSALNEARFGNLLTGDRALQRKVLSWDEAEVVFLCVGTLCERKGQRDALLALQSIVDRIEVPLRLVFLGEASGGYAREIRRLAWRLQAGEGHVRVDFVDSTADVGQYYLSADVFLLCSHVESYPRVILEALAFGMPIVATRVFGIAEQIPDADDACFFEPGDVGAMARLMLQMANDASRRAHYRRRSRARHAGMASFDEMVSAYESVIRGCLT